MSNDAILEVPVLVVSGPPGQSLLVAQATADLIADVGRDGDRAVIRDTGAEWLKTAGAWAATGANFWGTLLEQASAAVSAAAGSAMTSTENAELTAADVIAAEAARDASIVNAQTYVDVATGNAAVADGATFDVQGSGDAASYRYRRVSAGVSALIATFPAKASIDAISANATGGDNAGAPSLLQVGDRVVAAVDGKTGQVRFLVPLDKDDLPPSDTLSIAETATGADNAGSNALIMIGDRVVAAVDPAGKFRFMKPLDPDDIPGASVDGAATAYADGSRYLVSPNEMWSQWVWPRTIEDDAGNQMWGSLGKSEGPLVANGTGLVGRPGPLWIGHREAYAVNANKVLIGYSEEGSGVWAARGKADDHNRPAILRHPNPAAPIKLVTFQSDHSGLQWSRFWRSTTLNPADLVLVGQTPTVPGDFHSYGQLWWNGASPNELRGCYRVGGFDTGVWSLFSCDPAGTMASWTHYNDKIGGEGTYFLTVPARDNSGTWLASVRHPTVAGAKKITLAKLKWDWSLVSGNGTVISANLTTEVTPVDILDHANVTVIATAAGDNRLRLFDAREYSDGLVRLLYADFPTVGKASVAGDYKIATYNPATNLTTIETVCWCGGKIQEEVSLNGEYVAGSGSSSYVSGACLTDRPTEIVATRWWGDYGDVVLCTRQGVDDWDELELDRAAGKIARPEGHARIYWEGGAVKEELTSRVSYWRGSGARGGYAMFYNFNADRITVDLTAFRSTFV
ncbi:MAG: hypothetical protein E5X86_33055 [Mesorhizobium sp.]|uniref:hypothetical protein n=3 Tax=Mesorhizobium sp. TaxID=1871066 RepID=UPI00120D65B2|nr:hypothetical protein [Mesorhizobium sp.]TIO12487.1 MAG: hypothetical protein E5X86_33055 [Mesorhizobium sp.]